MGYCSLNFTLSQPHKYAPDAMVTPFVVKYDGDVNDPGPHSLRGEGQSCVGQHENSISATMTPQHYSPVTFKMTALDTQIPTIEISGKDGFLKSVKIDVEGFTEFMIEDFRYIVEHHADNNFVMLIVYINSHQYK